MKDYYSKRALEYEESYYRDDPKRELELQNMTDIIKEIMADRDVLEVACGTGYWTERIGSASRSIVGVDITPETLDIARNKEIPNSKFVIGDAFRLDQIEGEFNAGLVNFWISHVELNNIGEFIDNLHRKLSPGAVVFMADNMYVHGIGGELVIKENDENTYKLRKLNDGTTYEIIKNYFDREKLKEIFEDRTSNLTINIGDCFWWVHYNVR